MEHQVSPERWDLPQSGALWFCRPIVNSGRVRDDGHAEQATMISVMNDPATRAVKSGRTTTHAWTSSNAPALSIYFKEVFKCASRSNSNWVSPLA